MKRLFGIFLGILLLVSPVVAPNTEGTTTTTTSGWYTTEGIWLSSDCVNLCHQYNYQATLTNEGKKDVDWNCYNVCIREGKLLPTQEEEELINAMMEDAPTLSTITISQEAPVPTLISSATGLIKTTTLTTSSSGGTGPVVSVIQVETTSSSGGSGGAAAPTQLTKICHIDENLMRDYDYLLRQLKEADAVGDTESANQIEEKIRALKQEIERSRTCEEVPMEVRTETATAEVARPIATSVIDKCRDANDWREKLSFYERLYSLNDEQLRDKGFSREEVLKIKLELREGVARLDKECKLQQSGEAGLITAVEKPVVASRPVEITDYYKKKIDAVVQSGQPVQEQIQSLKRLRGEIDELIERLVKEKEEIAFDEMEGLVEEIEMTPTSLIVDDNNIEVTNKEISTRIGNMELRIRQLEDTVAIEQGGRIVKVNADSVTIREGNLNIGGKAISIAPSEAIAAAKLVPKEVVVDTVGEKAVYRISAENQKRLFWVIPVVVSEEAVVDAESGSVISINAPWWSALAFG